MHLSISELRNWGVVIQRSHVAFPFHTSCISAFRLSISWFGCLFQFYWSILVSSFFLTVHSQYHSKGENYYNGNSVKLKQTNKHKEIHLQSIKALSYTDYHKTANAKGRVKHVVKLKIIESKHRNSSWMW